MNFKIIEEEDFATEGTILTDKGVVKYMTLRVVAVSKTDITNKKYGVVNYKVGNRKKAMDELKQNLSIVFG